MNKEVIDLNVVYPSKKQIIYIILIVLISLTSLLILLEKQFPIKLNQYENNDNLRIKNFYAQNFSITNNIVIVGSSHAGFINATFVEGKIQTELSTNYRVFNLGKAADLPIDRLQEIEKIINMKPKLVIYGISYRDFPIIDQHDFILSKTNMILSKLLNDGKDFVNPQLFTRYSILNNGFTPEPKPSDCFFQSNTPLIIYCPSYRNVESIKGLMNMQEPIKNGDYEENKIALSKMIERLNNANIKVVLFVTPVHQIYLDHLSNPQKSSFDKLINDLKRNYGYVEIYDFRHKYDDQLIWQTISHIAISNGSIFDMDIAKMIIQELE